MIHGIVAIKKLLVTGQNNLTSLFFKIRLEMLKIGKIKYTLFPQDKYELEEMINHEIKQNGNECDLNHIDVSKITDMSGLFSFSYFNGDISQWDVSNVENMESMFGGSSFNGDISEWDVSRVRNMAYMFANTDFIKHHNPFCSQNCIDISGWDVSNVENMVGMFFKSCFTGDISKWDVSKVKWMDNMFKSSKFNGDLSEWNTKNAITMSNMFAYSEFNTDIRGWDISNVKDMSGMFQFSNFNASFLPICKINPQCNTEYMFLKCGKKNVLKYIDPSVDSIF
jgi:hypothetical protein